MSLFNPNYVGLLLLDYGYIDWLGIGGPWTVLVLALHVVWSISVPIAMIERSSPIGGRRRGRVASGSRSRRSCSSSGCSR